MTPEPRAPSPANLLKSPSRGGWSLGATDARADNADVAAAHARSVARRPRRRSKRPRPVPRYRFNCVTPVPAFAPLGRLEEVWASSRYMTFTGCVVSYVGTAVHALTPEESAIVDVVAEAGGDVGDRERTFLTVLTASTRVDPSRLYQALAEFGRPIIDGS